MSVKLKIKKILSILLCLCMVLQYVPVAGFAATDDPCDHHTEHTADCGYAAAVEPAAEPASVCDCGTDDPAIHATTCGVYVVPEDPECCCAGKCTEVNIWCDVCGFDVTACAGAETADPYGTQDSGVYEIATADDLFAFAELVNGNAPGLDAKLTANITVTGDWTPIGTQRQPYEGIFDGQGYTISGLNFDDTGSAVAICVGLFGHVGREGAVRNVGVLDSDYLGIAYVGGVVGYNEGIVENCYHTGTITGEGSDIGGVVGRNEGTVTNCYNIGAVSGDLYVGGVVGYNDGTVTNCYYDNSVCSDLDSVGDNSEGTATEVHGKSTGQFASGEVAYLLGSAWGQTIGTDKYPVLGGAKVYRTIGCGGGDGEGYSNTEGTFTHVYDNGFCICSGNYQPATLEGGVYLISNAGQLYWFADKVNNDNANYRRAKAKLTADIIVNKNVLNADGTLNGTPQRTWTPICRSYSQSFLGTFDGNGKTIIGLYFNDSAANFVGLFGAVTGGGTIRNVRIMDSYFSGNERVGGVVGYSYYGTVQNCYSSATVSGNDYVGGMVGYSCDSTIQDCGNVGTVSGTEHVGGVVGNNYQSASIVTNCYNTGTVSGDSMVGGVAGCNYDSSVVAQCYNSGTVTGGSYVSGVSGYNTAYGTVTNCYNTGTVSGNRYVGGVEGFMHLGTLTNCYNTGTVSGSEKVGNVLGGGTDSDVTITNCYYLSDNVTNARFSGRTIDQFHSGEVAYLLQQGNTEQVWGQDLDNAWTKQPIPTFNGATVYPVLGCDDTTQAYSNTEGKTGVHVYDQKGFCICSGIYQCAELYENGCYEIHNAGQLFWFAQRVNSGYSAINAILTTDIDLETLPWAAMGQQADPYTGTFDGQGYTISNMSCNTGLDEGTRACFVYYLGADGCIKNVTFDRADVFTQGHADANASAVVALKNSGTIESVAVSNSQVQLGAYAYLAGIAGVNESSGVIKNCAVVHTALNRRFGHNLPSGAIVHYNLGAVENCFAYNCSYGTANASNGGIVVTGNAPVNSYYYTTYTVAAADYARPAEAFASGEVAYLLNGDQSTIVFKQTIGTDAYPDFKGETVYRVANCNGDTCYRNVNENIAHVWENGFCTSFENHYEPAVLNESGVYEISNPGQLFWFAQQVNGGEATINAVLTADIDLENRAWTPIGIQNESVSPNVKVPYKGIFDGQNHVIKNLSVHVTDGREAGLFGRAQGATLTNFGVENAAVVSDPVNGASYRAGIIAGELHQCTVTNVYSTGNLTVTTAHTQAGGIAGECAESTLTGCYTTYGCLTANDAALPTGVTNCFYLAERENTGSCGEYKTAEQFASGEVAYLLNGDQSAIVFKQTIGTDATPNFTGKTVYIVANCKGETRYRNVNQDFDHVWENGICTVCGTVCGHVWEIGICAVCGTVCNDHVWENGFCTYGCYQSAGGRGTQGNPYTISNAGQLYWFAAVVNTGYRDVARNDAACAALTADIVVNEGTMTADSTDVRVWTPIGRYGSGLDGSFDGRNHTISGLYLNDSEGYGAGFIGHVNGSVQNVGIINSYLSGNYYVGGVAGYNYGTVTNCYHTGAVSGNGSVGGVVGYNGYKGTVTNCYNTGTVSGNGSVGGVAGYNDKNVENCYNTGAVSGSTNVGGVAGYNYSTVTNCYNTGAVSGSTNVGGVAGYNYSTVTNCYHTGAVSGSENVGGAVGYNDSATVSNCYYDNTVYTGAAIGKDDGGTATNVEGKTTDQFASGEVAYLLNGDQSTIVFKQTIGTDAIPNFTGARVNYGYTCDVTVTEKVYTNAPVSDTSDPRADHSWTTGTCTVCGVTCDDHVWGNGACITCGFVCTGQFDDNGFCHNGCYERAGGSGTAEAPYTIGNAGQLYWFAAVVNTGYCNAAQNTEAHAILTADIVVNEGTMTADSTDARVWTPIGTYGRSCCYDATFDGNGKTVSGLYFNDSSTDYVGFFGYSVGDVKNVGIINSCLIGDRYVGGVVGYSDGIVTNCYYTGIVSGNRNVGGVVGYNWYVVTNCYHTGAVSGSENVGGVVGYNNYADVINCYYDNTVYTGAAIGNNYNGTETNVEGKTTDQFASGEVAYLLQGEQTEQVWGQTIGTDASPVLGGEKVYFDENAEPPYYNEKPEIIATGWSGATQWTLTDDGVITFYGEGNMKNYGYNGGQPWLDKGVDITAVVIEEGVTSVGSGAFRNLTTLETVSLPDTLTQMGEAAFYGTGLTSVEIPASLWTIRPYTFKNCTSLTEVKFNEGNLQKISDGAFYNTGLTELVLPDCLDILDVYAFKGCAKLASITIGSGLTELREAVFYGTAIPAITVPEGITKIGPYAFKNCVKLETIDLPSTLKSVGEASFYACTGLKTVNLPDAVTTIGNYAFRKCAAIEELTFGSELTSIGECAFYGCTGLTEIVIPDKVTTIKPYAFKTCTGLTSVTLGSSVKTIGEGAFNTCTGLKTIVFPASVTSIGDYGFSGSYSLWKLTFEGNAPSIGTGAFKGLNAYAYYPGDNATWTSAVKQNYGGKITWTAN